MFITNHKVVDYTLANQNIPFCFDLNLTVSAATG